MTFFSNNYGVYNMKKINNIDPANPPRHLTLLGGVPYNGFVPVDNLWRKYGWLPKKEQDQANSLLNTTILGDRDANPC